VVSIHVTQDTVLETAFVNTVMNLQLHKMRTFLD
jgi:hypothetical protein